jgi:hypothetical protein
MHGMDSVYIHITDDMRKRLCGYLQGLWETAIAERYELAPRSAVPLLDQALVAHGEKLQQEAAEEFSTQHRLRARTPADGQSRGRLPGELSLNLSLTIPRDRDKMDKRAGGPTWTWTVDLFVISEAL